MSAIGGLLTNSNGQYNAEVQQILNLTSRFLYSTNKENFLKTEELGELDETILDTLNLFDMIAPVKLHEDYNFKQYTINQNLAIASVAAEDTEIPLFGSGSIKPTTFEGFRVATSTAFTAQQQMEADNLIKETGIPSPFVESLYSQVNNLQPRIVNLQNALLAQALTTGVVNFTDPKSKQSLELDYKPEPTLVPEGLTGGDLWQNTSARGLDHLRELNQKYRKVNGFYAHYALMSNDDYSYLIKQTYTATAAATLHYSYNSTLPGIIGKNVLEEMCKATQTPIPYVFDGEYQAEIKPGVTRNARFFPKGTVVLVRKNMGNRLMLKVVESGRGINKARAGIHNGIKNLHDDTLPPVSYAIARCFPHIKDSRQICSQKVA